MNQNRNEEKDSLFLLAGPVVELLAELRAWTPCGSSAGLPGGPGSFPAGTCSLTMALLSFFAMSASPPCATPFLCRIPARGKSSQSGPRAAPQEVPILKGRPGATRNSALLSAFLNLFHLQESTPPGSTCQKYPP